MPQGAVSAAAPPVVGPSTPERITHAVLAVAALVLGVVIAFVADHSATFGLTAFATFAIVAGAATAAEVAIRARRGRPWGLALLRALVTLTAAAVALAVPGGTVGLFVALVSGWALVTGALTIVEGILARRRDGSATLRDALLGGGLTVLLALALLVIPPDFVEPWRVLSREGAVEAEGAVTTSIMAVGLLGAWAVVVGVLQTIAVLSPRERAR